MKTYKIAPTIGMAEVICVVRYGQLEANKNRKHSKCNVSVSLCFDQNDRRVSAWELTRMQRTVRWCQLSGIRLNRIFRCLVLTSSSHHNRIYSGRQILPTYGSFLYLAPFSSNSNKTAISFNLINLDWDRARTNGSIDNEGNTSSCYFFVEYIYH